MKKQTVCKKFAMSVGIASLVSLLTVLPASATIIAETDALPGIGYAPDADFFGDLSFSFTTDASDYTFNSVTLLTGYGNFGQGTFSVSLNNDNGGNNPGSLLEDLNGDSNPTNMNALYQYTGSSILTANTTYWITLSNNDFTYSSFYDIQSASSTNESAASAWSIGDDIYSSSMGYQSATGPIVSQFDATAISVNPTPVPAPAPALLFIFALAMFIGLRRKSSDYL
jgi:hypothetical protein